jgi:hypothetical protein
MDNEFNRFFNAIRNLIRKECHKPNDMIYGKIVSVDPLKIDIGGNIILEKEKLFLGQMCRPYKVTIPHKHLINPVLTEDSLAITTPSISAGTAASPLPNIQNYTIKDQTKTYNESDGTTTRTLQTQSETSDCGGATLAMSIDVTGSTSTVTGTAAVPQGNSVTGSATIVSTTDLSTFTVTDNKHHHLVPEHETLDVHFAGSDYEESVTIEIEPKLHINDKVLMFAFNNNQMYYVAERIEE